MPHGVTPEPPPGSEHYREGWRDGYEQAEINLRAELASQIHSKAISERFLREALETERARVVEMQNELALRRASVTTGGPPVPFTEHWKPGDSTRPPTAPPEEIVVALPVSDEEAETLVHLCLNCGRPHPADSPICLF